MTTKILFAIRDTKVSVYESFHIEENEISAIRGLSIALENKNTKLAKWPDEHHLYKMATIDAITGTVEPCEPPIYLTSAATLINEAKKNEITQ